MMSPEIARQLFAYDAWANRRSLGACAALTPEQFTRDLGSSFHSVRDTLAHIVGAQFVRRQNSGTCAAPGRTR